MAGDHPAVIESALAVGDDLPYYNYWHLGLNSAILLGDAAAARSIIELIPGGVGRRFEVLREIADTALELLEGSRDAAALGFMNVISRLEEVETERYGAEWGATFAAVMPERTEARAAAAEARKWFTSVGARGPLELFSAAWDAIEGEAAAG